MLFCINARIKLGSLMSDIDIYNFQNDLVRGGISSVLGDRYVKANNKYMKDYDSSKPSSYILYIDANKLYGGIMTSSLPTGNHKFEDPTLFDEKFILNYDFENTKKGYDFKVDLIYPKELFELHKNYPCCPQQLKISKKDLSSYQQDLLDNNKDILNGNCEKLILSLYDKKNYTISGAHLKLVLQLGLKLSKIHEVISYTQAPFMRDYVMDLTRKRTIAKQTNDKEADMRNKLMVNCVFGRTMLNKLKQKKISIITNREKFIRLNTTNMVKSINVFCENFVAIEEVKKEVVLDAPMYVGAAILEKSKIYMYNFYYNVIKKNMEIKQAYYILILIACF
jgi:hypothetical protein